jgi:hypothetical protein
VGATFGGVHYVMKEIFTPFAGQENEESFSLIPTPTPKCNNVNYKVLCQNTLIYAHLPKKWLAVKSKELVHIREASDPVVHNRPWEVLGQPELDLTVNLHYYAGLVRHASIVLNLSVRY